MGNFRKALNSYTSNYSVSNNMCECDAERVACTHNGRINVDVVYATATLIMCGVKHIMRTGNLKDAKSLADSIIYDIGGDTYDCHYNSLFRDTGVKVSTFGLIWADFGKEAVEKACQILHEGETYGSEIIMNIVESIESTIVRRVDELTFEEEYESEKDLFYLMEMLNSSDDDSIPRDDNDNDRFTIAVNIAIANILSTIDRIFESEVTRYYVERQVIESTILKGQVLILTRPAPFKRTIENLSKTQTQTGCLSDLEIAARQIKFVISPSNPGGYIISTIKDQSDKTRAASTTRKGLTYELIDGVTFNQSHDIARVHTLPAAIQLCEKSLEE